MIERTSFRDRFHQFWDRTVEAGRRLGSRISEIYHETYINSHTIQQRIESNSLHQFGQNFAGELKLFGHLVADSKVSIARTEFNQLTKTDPDPTPRTELLSLIIEKQSVTRRQCRTEANRHFKKAAQIAQVRRLINQTDRVETKNAWIKSPLRHDLIHLEDDIVNILDDTVNWFRPRYPQPAEAL